MPWELRAMQLSEVLKSSLLITPELILILTGIVVILLDSICKARGKGLLLPISLLGIAYAFLQNTLRFNVFGVAFAGSLSIDLFSAYFSIIFLIGSFMSLVLSRDYISKMRLRAGEYYALILFSTSAMMLIASAKELMTLFIGFEIMSIAAYILSGFNRSSARSIEAGAKYLVLGGFSSAILLYGIALLYGGSGSIYIDQIAKGFDPSNPLIVAGTALTLSGFIFKIGAFPFHQWIPDVYEGAPVTVTGFMAVAVKAAAFAILIRVVFVGLSGLEASLVPVLWTVSLLTMVVGNFTALVQTSIKRMLAFSSIAHAGYALVGVVAAFSEKTLGIGGVLYYMLAYTFMNLGAFGVLAYLSREGEECETYEDIAGLWRRKPFTAIALGVFMLSLAGVPPFVGFFAKYRVFLSGIAAKHYWLVAVGILASVLSAYYYLRVLVYAYMRQEAPRASLSFSIAPAAALFVLTTATVIAGVIDLRTWELALKAADTVLGKF